jgi:fluoride exporter
MPVWVLVGAGGALGAMARHALNHVVHQRALASVFPLGIFIINVTGSILIGLIAGWLASGRLQWAYPMRTFVIVGVLGGFTTFSSFSLDTLALARDGHLEMAVWNVAGQTGLGLAGVWAGFRLGHL